MIQPITENIYSVGVTDTDLKVFDVVMETKYGTSYNAYLIKTDNHVILVETVKFAFFDEYISRLKELIQLEEIDYLIVNHTEPDHSGSIEKLLSYNPDIEIIGSKAAAGYLGEIINRDFKHHIVKPDEELVIDGLTFHFYSVPFLHWPDSIYTYIKEKQVLFTCDSFGAHYAYPLLLLSKLPEKEMDNYLDAFKYYYDSIFTPFKRFVLQALEKIGMLEIKYICTGHGPVIDVNHRYYLDTYQKWSEPKKPYDRLIVIPYATSYGYTEEMAKCIEQGIKAFDPNIAVHPVKLDVSDYEALKPKVLEEIGYADALIIGSTTINKAPVPIISDLVLNLSPITNQGRLAAVFGSYGWSGEGVDVIHEELKLATLKVLPYFKLKFKPDNEAKAVLVQYGKELAQAIFDRGEVTLVNNHKIGMKV